jgi:two-component system chemotaxis sensor kinase CheA
LNASGEDRSLMPGSVGRPRASFTRQTLLAFGAMDLTFKCLVIRAYLDLVAREPSRTGFAIEAALGATTIWLVVMLTLTRRVDSWRRTVSAGPSEQHIRRAGAQLRRLPQWLSLAWAAQWFGLFSFLFAYGAAPLSWLGAGFFLGAMALGPPPLAHSLSTWLLAPVVREHSLLARSRGAQLPDRFSSLAGRLVLYNLCIAVAPTSYMAAAAFTVATGQLPVERLLSTTLVFLAGVAVFAVLCAGLLSRTLTGPVAEMASLMRTIIRRGEVARVSRIPQFEADEVGALAELTNQMIDRLENATAERAAATDSLAALNRDLEQRVQARTAELSARTADMRLVLDNVNEGLFTIDRSGAIASEYSATLSKWFGVPEPGQVFHRYWARHARDFGQETQLAWEQVIDGLLPLELALDQMPAELALAGHRYGVSYEAIGDGGRRFLVIVSDRTDALEQERTQRERRETLALFEHMLSDRSGFVSFLREASAIVSQVAAARPGDERETRRAIHTLKGNALLFGLETVADLCHALESRMEDEQACPDSRELHRLEQRWAQLQTDVDRLLGEKRHVIEISPERHAEIERATREGAPRDVLLRLVQDLRLEPVETRLRQLAEQARQLAQRLDKQVHVDIQEDGVRVHPARWARFWSVLVHAVRNAVDHGIESPELRSQLGKPVIGQISLRARREPAQLVFEVSDDGRGIPWEQVRARCLSQGLPAETPEVLLAALFADGLSTAAQVTAISGRGVGMGALQAVVQELDGELEVSSHEQRGTLLRMRFPTTGEEASALPPRAVISA